ncbi:MAG: efflux RND transporter periplasmic adaptor subunit [Deltaproteobacteria bacterium]|jgi:cobalt-zinc-cadmium efflux system membrane fusion protein|nr:efflux RND transporter periplasmic adaptor subunit [Deltaproteobacteria bacterium]
MSRRRHEIGWVLGLVLVVSLAAAALASGPHDDEHGSGHGSEHGAEHGSEDGHAEGELAVRPGDLARFGITVGEAQSGALDGGVELVGEVHPDGDRLAHITPRFPGIVREVRRNVGDRVRKGEVLAIVESSESLSPYELTTLVDGVVIAKHITRGEAVGSDHEAFVVADLGAVWVDLRVHQKELGHVRVGQLVSVRTAPGDVTVTAPIRYVTPVLDPATRTATARVVVENGAGAWRPGMFVAATVLDLVPVDVQVAASAVQTVEGRPSVFVVSEHVEPRAVVLGRRGRTRVEVLSGLAAGERVAVTNTFLLKAELGKSEAEHEH